MAQGKSGASFGSFRLTELFAEKMAQRMDAAAREAAAKRAAAKPAPPKPVEIVPVGPTALVPISEMDARLSDGAAYFHTFDHGAEPFRVARGISHAIFADEGSGLGYLSLADGAADAVSMSYTGGYSILLPDAIEAAASGRRIIVRIGARAADGARSRFAVAYSTAEVGNSGWRWFEATADWAVFTMEWNVPVMRDGGGDYLGLLPDIAGNPGAAFRCLSITIV